MSQAPYIFSCVAVRFANMTNSINTLSGCINAESALEAEGMVMRIALARFPTASGFKDHSISAWSFTGPKEFADSLADAERQASEEKAVAK